MSVDAFAASDLSTPLTPYQGSRLLTTTQKVAGAFSNRVVFAVDEPFLIRVGAVDPFMGDYVLRSHKHVGASFDDAIVLNPFTPLDQQQLAASAPSTVCHSLIQHRLHSGARQQLTFTTTEASERVAAAAAVRRRSAATARCRDRVRGLAARPCTWFPAMQAARLRRRSSTSSAVRS